MHVLAFYTSGPACEIALLDGSTLMETLRVPMRRGQDVQLPGLTKDVLAGGRLSLTDIDRFAVITGPGSFTGIRIGVAFARGLALACDKPCLGITSLEASLPAGQQGSALVVLPAQTRPPELTFWTQTFRSGSATAAPAELAPADIKALLQSHPHMVYGADLSASVELAGIASRPALPSAQRAAELASQLDPELHLPEPVYARAPDAVPASPNRA